MKNSSSQEEKISFLNFTFNPALRILQQDDITQQLRKKQSDVLVLLCKKYPAPVSQEEFQAKVWNGSYVTPQSIAQMIRSLRLSLKDEDKNIIVTIPKLGYQLTAQPTWIETEAVKDKPVKTIAMSGRVTADNLSCSNQSVINYQPPPPTTATTMTVIPYSLHHKTSARKISSRKWLVSAVALLCFSLFCVAMSARGYSLNFFDEGKTLLTGTLMTPYSRVKVMDNFFYCCKTESGLVCSPRATMVLGKCRLYSEKIELD